MIKVVELGSKFLLESDECLKRQMEWANMLNRPVPFFQGKVTTSTGIPDKEIDEVRKRIMEDCVNSNVRVIECVADKRSSWVDYNKLADKKYITVNGVYLDDVVGSGYNIEIPRDHMDGIVSTNKKKYDIPMTLENIKNGAIEIPDDCQYILCSNIFLIGQLLSATDEEIPEIFKKKPLILGELQKLEFSGSYYSKIPSEISICMARYGGKDGSMENILRLVQKKHTKLNCITRKMIGDNCVSYNKTRIFNCLDKDDMIEAGITILLGKMPPMDIYYFDTFDKVPNDIMGEIILKVLENNKTAKILDKIVTATPKDAITKKEVRKEIIAAYKIVKGKKLPGINLLLPYLTKEDAEEIGIEKIKNSINKLTSTSSTYKLKLMSDFNKLISDNKDLTDKERKERERMEYYKLTAMSKFSFPAFMTYLNFINPDFLEAHKEELIETLFNAIIKLGYYAPKEAGCNLDNETNIAIIGPEFCNQLNKKRITVVKNVLDSAKSSRYSNSLNQSEKEFYVKMLKYIDCDKHDKLAKAQADMILE